VFYDAKKNDHGFAADPFKAVVAPRPIAWISSLSASGIANLAPYSFFNAFAAQPHYIAFGSGDGFKDTLSNIQATGEFAVNLVTFDLREAMNATSARLAPNVDEFEAAGLSKAPCRMVACPRVADSPVTFECKHFQTVDLPGDTGTVEDRLVIGRVVGIHIDDRFIAEGRVNTAAMRLVARLGYSEYATVEAAWRMRRPS
jgi:flavin reductase (DIM6/NTAB) family NADH-FMN oxidoreductase RutF